MRWRQALKNNLRRETSSKEESAAGTAGEKPLSKGNPHTEAKPAGSPKADAEQVPSETRSADGFRECPRTAGRDGDLRASRPPMGCGWGGTKKASSTAGLPPMGCGWGGTLRQQADNNG